MPFMSPHHPLTPRAPRLIKKKRHAPSAFVISLKPPQPPSVLEAVIRVDLLAHYKPLPLVEELDYSQSLSLCAQDLEAQLREQCVLLTQEVADTPAAAPVNFEPTPTSALVLRSLDLPEDEEDDEDESELVTLDDLRQPKHTGSFLIFAQNVFAWFPQGTARTLVSFVVLSLLFVGPLHAMSLFEKTKQSKEALTHSFEQAAENLNSGASAALSRDGAAAGAAFASAQLSFAQATSQMQDLGASLNLLLAQTQTGRTAKQLLEAGDALAQAGELIARGLETLDRTQDLPPTDRLRILLTYLEDGLVDLKAAANALEGIDLEHIPPPYQATLDQAKETLPAVSRATQELIDFAKFLGPLLGSEQTMRYLVLFQNNTETRATGGFIGSFAEIDITDGQIVRLNIPTAGSYDLQGQFAKQFVPPRPLQLLSPTWEFRDGNWFPDFPTSAKTLLTLYENNGGPTVDGVIAINATYVASLLALLGPIDMPSYGRTITTDNFLLQTQTLVEHEYDKEQNTPKAFIADLAPALVKELVARPSKDLLPLLDHLGSGLTNRHVQIYLRDPIEEAQLLKRGWGGALIQTSGDYLMVVNSNLGGQKSDAVIKEDLALKSVVQEDDSIINTLTIVRTHFGQKGDPFVGVNNVNYLRAYVPAGSELLRVSGTKPPTEDLFETLDPSQTDSTKEWQDVLAQSPVTSQQEADRFNESGKTVFGVWTQTKPGETTTTTLTYRLPFSFHRAPTSQTPFSRVKHWLGLAPPTTYQLVLQNPSGVIDRVTEVSVDIPENTPILWSSHDHQNARLGETGNLIMSLVLGKSDV